MTERKTKIKRKNKVEGFCSTHEQTLLKGNKKVTFDGGIFCLCFFEIV